MATTLTARVEYQCTVVNTSAEGKTFDVTVGTQMTSPKTGVGVGVEGGGGGWGGVGDMRGQYT